MIRKMVAPRSLMLGILPRINDIMIFTLSIVIIWDKKVRHCSKVLSDFNGLIYDKNDKKIRLIDNLWMLYSRLN